MASKESIDPSEVKEEELGTLEGVLKGVKNAAMNTGRRFFLKPIFATLEEWKSAEEKEKGTCSLKSLEEAMDMFIEEAKDVKTALALARSHHVDL